MTYAASSSVLLIQYTPDSADSFIPPLPLPELPFSQTVNKTNKPQKKHPQKNKKNPHQNTTTTQTPKQLNAAGLEDYSHRTQSESLNNAASLNTSEEVKETKGSCQHACKRKELSAIILGNQLNSASVQ